MNIEIFSLCDAATIDKGGKLNILGAFDAIWFSKIPSIHRHCAVALRFRFGSIENGQHNISVNFVDLDGKHILPPANGKVAISIPDGQGTASSNLILSINGLKIEKFGQYSIDLAINGRHEASLPLFIKEKK